jgi:hypothetical protein
MWDTVVIGESVDGHADDGSGRHRNLLDSD